MALSQTSTGGNGDTATEPYRDLSAAQIVFQVGGRPADEFLVHRYRGTEGLCQLYRFEIELSTTATAVEFKEFVGKAAVLSVNSDAGTRWFHGVISRFEYAGETLGETSAGTTHTVFFRAELVPSVWLLTHRYNSRVFQNKTVTEIITKVLTDGGIPTDRFNISLSNAALREYCVQYRETDYNFIARLMEEEGARWYFAQSIDGHIFEVTDAGHPYPAIPGDKAELPFVPPSGMPGTEEHVYRFRLSQAVRPGAIVLNDFNFENPGLPLEAKADCSRDPGLEFFDYPGEYKMQGDGRRYATVRAEEFEAGRTTGVGLSNSYRLAPGFMFALTEHPLDINGDYLVTSVTHYGRQSTGRTTTSVSLRNGVLDPRLQQGLIAAMRHEDAHVRQIAEGLIQMSGRLRSGDASARRELTNWLYHGGQVSRDLASAAAGAGGNSIAATTIPNLLDDTSPAMLDDESSSYGCRFECIPASVTYRPARVTPWPVMRGCQTARVTGPDGDEIHTDEYGRVKVQFNWDREGKFNETSSCWIRSVQALAGGGYGMMFLPRIGQEVIVGFLEGDPDQPIIVGCVYNKHHMPPYALPEHKSRSVIKGCSTNGGGGSNEIRFEDLKDKEQILIYGQKDLHMRFKNDAVHNIEHDYHLTVDNDRKEQVKKNYHLKLLEGDQIVEIGKDLSHTVKGKVSMKIEGTQAIEVTGDCVEKYGANQKIEATSGTVLIKASNIKLEATAGIEIMCGGSSIQMSSSSLHITSGTVHINSAPGAPVGPVSAGLTAPLAPEAPEVAESVVHGSNTRYGGGQELVANAISPGISGSTFEPTTRQEEPTSWIDIELLDEEGNPVPGERYKVIDPEGREFEGTLDANGRAHIAPVAPGDCQIFYTELDTSAVQQQS